MPQVISKLAKDIVRGDRIELDVGYGPREHLEFCKVNIPGETHSQLFPDPSTADHLSFHVSSSSGNFWTISFPPNYAFNTIPK